MRQMGHGVRRVNIQLSAQKLKPNAQYSAQAVFCSRQQFPTRVCLRNKQRNTIKMGSFTSAPQGKPTVASANLWSSAVCYPQYWTCIILRHHLLYLRIQSWEVLAAVPFSVECFRVGMTKYGRRLTRTISIGLPSFYSVEQTVTVPQRLNPAFLIACGSHPYLYSHTCMWPRVESNGMGAKWLVGENNAWCCVQQEQGVGRKGLEHEECGLYAGKHFYYMLMFISIAQNRRLLYVDKKQSSNRRPRSSSL